MTQTSRVHSIDMVIFFQFLQSRDQTSLNLKSGSICFSSNIALQHLIFKQLQYVEKTPTTMAPTLNFVTVTSGLRHKQSSLHGAATVTPLSGRPWRSHALTGSRAMPRRHASMAVASTSGDVHTLDGVQIDGELQPCGQNVLVRVAEAEEVTTGGIILPDQAQEKPTFGDVVAVGPGKILGNGVKVPMVINKGDRIVYGKYGGTDLTYDGEKHTMVTQDDILGKLTNGTCEPIYDRVLIKAEEKGEEMVGGIILAASANENKQNSGKVISIGQGRFMENGELEPASIAPGDIAFYSKYAGTEVTVEGEEYVIVRVADIYAKI